MALDASRTINANGGRVDAVWDLALNESQRQLVLALPEQDRAAWLQLKLKLEHDTFVKKQEERAAAERFEREQAIKEQERKDSAEKFDREIRLAKEMHVMQMEAQQAKQNEMERQLRLEADLEETRQQRERERLAERERQKEELTKQRERKKEEQVRQREQEMQQSTCERFDQIVL